jgi:hypothetical protein
MHCLAAYLLVLRKGSKTSISTNAPQNCSAVNYIGMRGYIDTCTKTIKRVDARYVLIDNIRLARTHGTIKW